MAVGSNLNEPVARCFEAIALLDLVDFCVIQRVAKFYLTEPVGVKEQPWFINTVVELDTQMTPERLLDRCQEIEQSMGRERVTHWGPRIIDLDILLMGTLVWTTERLTIPHPRLHQRKFALQPLCDLIPEAIHPTFNLPYAALLATVDDTTRIEELAGITWSRQLEQ